MTGSLGVSRAMAVVTVVSVLLASGAVCTADVEDTTGAESRSLLDLNLLYPGRRTRQDVSEERDEDAITHMLPVLIPVRYNLRRPHDTLERSSGQDDPVSPRLVMDKYFNIKFDNPYVVPLTKPLAFILNSAPRAREARASGEEKMIIPYPVLTKTVDEPRSAGCKDDDVLEHRSNYEVDADFFDESPPQNHKTSVSVSRPFKNTTTPFHRTNVHGDRPLIYSARGKYQYHYPHYSHDKYPPKGVVPMPEYRYNSSFTDHPDVYPSKIFADMYRTMKPSMLSAESRERDSFYRQYDKRRHTQDDKLNAKVNSLFRGQTFSASNGLQWVTAVNSSDATKHDKTIVIYDVTEAPSTTSTIPWLGPGKTWGNKIT